MNRWPHDWRERVLRVSGIPVTPFAKEVLSAWRKSTPCEPWTNNPLGMPARGNRVPRALNTPYAAFPTYQAFTEAIARHLQTNRGNSLLTVLISADSKAAAWREIHALKWPANDTESEYPAALLDQVQAAYTDKLAARETRKNTSAGTQHAAPSVHDAVRQQSMAMHHAATQFSDASKAIRHIIGRLG